VAIDKKRTVAALFIETVQCNFQLSLKYLFSLSFAVKGINLLYNALLSNFLNVRVASLMQSMVLLYIRFIIVKS
jgi:hypothetical protein